jgi:hypothetical protein
MAPDIGSSAEALQSSLPFRHPGVTGWQGSETYFRFIECDEIRPALVIDTLRGKYLGVIFRDVVPAETRRQLITNFVTSPGCQKRDVDAPGEYLGAYHYNKTTNAYLDQADAIRADLDAALNVPSEPLRELFRRLREALTHEGIDLRPARHGGREAPLGVFRSWLGQQEFALNPHEDLGQCEDPKQAGFEIQQVAAYQILGLNVCLSNGSGGRLAVWNLRPDETTRKRLGVQYTGSPYSTNWLSGIEQLWLDVRPGDIYLFNAAHVHAVEQVRDLETRRVTISGILGFADEKTVISWT